MDIMEKITDLRAQKKALADQAEGLAKDGKFDEMNSPVLQRYLIPKMLMVLSRYRSTMWNLLPRITSTRWRCTRIN